MSTASLPAVDLASPSRSPLLHRWLALLGCVLLGYIVLGKGFAYVGFPPLFIGDLTVAAGVACLLVHRGWRAVFRLTPIQVLCGFMGLGLLLTLRDLPAYKLDAMRDAVLWGYGAVAIVVAAAFLAEPRLLHVAVRLYARAADVLLLLIPPLWAIDRVWSDSLPTWPWADVAILYVKGGDCLVHLAGILALWLTGLARPTVWRMVLMVVAVGVIGASNRGGLLSVLLVGCLGVLLRPRGMTARNLAVIAVAALLVIAAADVSIPMPGKDREISSRQLFENLASIATSEHGEGELQNTKEWRLQWWTAIVDYTVFGDHFWTGKGFGVNLADDDGFQVNDPATLRSPHNGHMTVLARMGVPGALLWVAVLGTWFLAMARGLVRTRRRGDAFGYRLLLLVLMYATACLVNATFDVFLEGPMGGIPFWALFGAGVAAATVYRRTDSSTFAPAHA